MTSQSKAARTWNQCHELIVDSCGDSKTFLAFGVNSCLPDKFLFLRRQYNLNFRDCFLLEQE